MVTILVTTLGTDGVALCQWYVDVDDEPLTIDLPDGARSVELVRPVRTRIDLSRHRARRAVTRPRRPSWRDDSDIFMWLRWWRAMRDGRRTARRWRDKRGGAAP